LKFQETCEKEIHPHPFVKQILTLLNQKEFVQYSYEQGIIKPENKGEESEQRKKQ
jgi:hypothetical protein